MGKIVSQTEFAEIIGKSSEWVRQLAKQGLPSERTNGRGKGVMIDTAAAINWLISRERTKQIPDDEDSSLDSETRRLRAAQADLAELDLSERRGELAPVEDYLIASQEAMVIVASQMDGLPGRVASQLAGITDAAEIRQLLLDETRRIRAAAAARLESWADMVASGESIEAAATEDAGPVG